MADSEQVNKQTEQSDEAQVEEAVEAKTGADELLDDVDELLDEIDEVLEENAEEFIKNYVQKGGQ